MTPSHRETSDQEERPQAARWGYGEIPLNGYLQAEAGVPILRFPSCRNSWWQSYAPFLILGFPCLRIFKDRNS